MLDPIRIAAMSDLHIEFERGLAASGKNPRGPRPENHPTLGPDLDEIQLKAPDLMILAGDIDKGIHAVDYAASVARYLGCPTCLVLGNHEYYDGLLPNTLDKMREAAKSNTGVHVMECDALVLNIRERKLRVLGCTLWTDYKYRGTPSFSANVAGQQLSDHRKIRTAAIRLFQPVDALVLHRKALAWLGQKMSQPFDGDTIIVSHHGVSRFDVPPQYVDDDLTPAFVSDLEGCIRAWQPALWITGHTHYSHEDNIGVTRLVSRQAGYPGENASAFSPWMGEI